MNYDAERDEITYTIIINHHNGESCVGGTMKMGDEITILDHELRD